MPRCVFVLIPPLAFQNTFTGEGGWIKSLLECRPFTVTSRLTVRAYTYGALPEPYQSRSRANSSKTGSHAPPNSQHHVLQSLPPTILNQQLKQYCAYLIHPAVIFWVYGDHLGPIHYSTVWCVVQPVCLSLSFSLFSLIMSWCMFFTSSRQPGLV